MGCGGGETPHKRTSSSHSMNTLLLSGLAALTMGKCLNLQRRAQQQGGGGPALQILLQEAQQGAGVGVLSAAGFVRWMLTPRVSFALGKLQGRAAKKCRPPCPFLSLVVGKVFAVVPGNLLGPPAVLLDSQVVCT